MAEHCPNLCELNLQSTYITDDGLFSLCGQDEGCGMTGVNGCPNLQRLIVSETRVTWIGAYEVIKCLQQLRDFDFDKIFQVHDVYILYYFMLVFNNMTKYLLIIQFRCLSTWTQIA